MNLPRWTAYLALAVIAMMLVSAIPAVEEESPSEGAAEIARSGAPVPTEYPRLVVFGIDGLDPDTLLEVLERYPGQMPNFEKLVAEGQGVRNLATSLPPQSPVAWSNFIVGRNPGGHGIFDFLHRDKDMYTPAPGTVTKVTAGTVWAPGKWTFPTQEGGDSNRSGKAFWTILGENGVPADVWRMPINFPVEKSKKGVSFPGMMTPAVDSAYGEPSLFSTDPPARAIGDEKIQQLNVRGGVAKAELLGPSNAFVEGNPRSSLPFEIYVDEEANAAVISIGGKSLVLEPKEWSAFTQVSFDMLPMGLMAQGGIVRFYLRSVSPELELYASPVNLDPMAPLSPVSMPEEAAAELAEEIGLYYTQGMAEDVNALKKEMLTDAEFMAQARLVFEERGRMLDMALDKYMKNEEGGFLFFYYSSVDLASHMMWRHTDKTHPSYDPAAADESSEWWTGRKGTTWGSVVDDLYLQMDSVLGEIRDRVGEETDIIVMSDHGFASYRRKFSLNTWLLEEGYLVLKEGCEKELPVDHADHRSVHIFDTYDPLAEEGERGDPARRESIVDWSKTRAFGMGFNSLYLNIEGREKHGSVKPSEVAALTAEIAEKLELIRDEDGTQVVIDAAITADIYVGERVDEAPEIQVGYNRGYCNSDESSLGRITNQVLLDNTGGTFNGSHLMAPSVVQGTILTNREITAELPRLEDLTVEILRTYGIQPDPEMTGVPVFRD